MTPFLKKLLVVLATGYLLLFFSEMMFWNELEFDGEGLLATAVQFLAMLLLYSAEAWALLLIISYFRVRTIGAIFLAGAAYGWLLEGSLFPTMYDNFPLHIPWTGLAWHALIDVLIGYYWLRRALLAKSLLPIIGLSAALGLFWGLWNIAWYHERTLISPTTFAVNALLQTAALILAFWLINRFHTLTFQPSWLAVTLLAILHSGFFLVVVLPAIPFAVLILPPLLFLLYLTLRRNRAVEPAADLLVTLGGPVSLLRYLAILLMPLVAAASYALYNRLAFYPPTNYVVLVVTCLITVPLFIVSIGRIWRSPMPAELVEAIPAAAG